MSAHLFGTIVEPVGIEAENKRLLRVPEQDKWKGNPAALGFLQGGEEYKVWDIAASDTADQSIAGLLDRISGDGKEEGNKKGWSM